VSMTDRAPHGSVTPDPETARRDLTRAWVSLALVPVAFVLATVTGEGLIAAAGYPSGDVVPPLWLALLIGVPLTLVVAAPAAAAVRYGRRARRGGQAQGLVAAVIGGVVLCYLAATLLLVPFSR